jgi:cytochrome c biogenesis protein CcdA/thiol-disulfide isomerase/thioredoxin
MGGAGSAGMLLLVGTALVAGVLTILSPCVLPVVPIALGGGLGPGRWRPAGIVVGLAGTFTTLSVLLASALSAVGITAGAMRPLVVAVLALLALTMLVPSFGRAWARVLAPIAQRGERFPAAGHPGFGGGIALGAALGLVWAPCAGPLMASVIAAAASQGPSPAAAAIALVYTAGAALPIAGIALSGRVVIERLRRASGGDRPQRVFGGLMLAACLTILLGLDTPLQQAMTRVLPAGWTDAIQLVERNPYVGQPLDLATGTTGDAARDASAPPGSVAVPGPGDTRLPAPVATELPARVTLVDDGAAPEVGGITAWINSGPLTMAALRGRVVLVHFWTFACVNCRNVQPYVKAWYARYHDDGFVVLSVHSPELSFERDVGNVRDAVKAQGVLYPVAVDPAFTTWNAYHNGYWPAFYWVDRTGEIRYVHAGEGDYAAQEAVLRALLSEPAAG